MASELVYMVTNEKDSRLVKVTYASVYSEYTCALYINDKHQIEADYYTDDIEEAIQTAETMAGNR